MNLAEAIQQRKQNTEDQFYSNLMQYAMQNTPQFDTSGKTPQFIGEQTRRLPSKTQLWNAYIQMKGGRLTPQDLAKFETTYNQIKFAYRDKQMNQLNQLSMRGYSDKKITNMVKESPVLYQNLLDMITELNSSGDENAMAQADVVKSYLPTKTFGERFQTSLEEEPFWTGAKTLGAAATAGVVAKYGIPWAINNIPEYWKSFKGNTPTDALNNWFDNRVVKKDGKWISKSTGREYGENIQKKFNELDKMKSSRSYKLGQQISTSQAGQLARLGGKVLGKRFGAEIGGYGAQFATGMLGAEEETAERIGTGTRGLLSMGMARQGLRGLTAAPHPYAKAIGYGGLGLLGAYDMFKALQGD